MRYQEKTFSLLNSVNRLRKIQLRTSTEYDSLFYLISFDVEVKQNLDFFDATSQTERFSRTFFLWTWSDETNTDCDSGSNDTRIRRGSCSEAAVYDVG